MDKFYRVNVLEYEKDMKSYIMEGRSRTYKSLNDMYDYIDTQINELMADLLSGYNSEIKMYNNGYFIVRSGESDAAIFQCTLKHNDEVDYTPIYRIYYSVGLHYDKSKILYKNLTIKEEDGFIRVYNMYGKMVGCRTGRLDDISQEELLSWVDNINEWCLYNDHKPGIQN